MTRSNRTDSTGPSRPRLVAVTEYSVWRHLLHRDGMTPNAPVVLGLSATAGLLAELKNKGCEIHVLGRPQSGSSTHLLLKQRARTTELNFGIPEVFDGKTCPILPEKSSDRRALLGRYDVLVVIGAEGLSIQLDRAPVPADAGDPAGVPAEVLA